MDSVGGSRNDIELPSFNVITTQVLRELPEAVKQEIEEDFDKSTYRRTTSLDSIYDPEVDQFAKDSEYYLSSMGFIVGFGNVLRFPYTVLENGGLIFLIPYFVCLFLVVFPVLTLETAWGQLLRTRLDQKFSVIHPGLWGLGLAMFWMNVMILPYYTTLFPYCLYYFFHSFFGDLPWKKETIEESIWNAEFFPSEVLQRTDNIEEPGSFVVQLVILMVITYLVLYFAMWKGIKSSSQFAHFTVPAPYFIMCVLLIKGISLPGSLKGYGFLVDLDWGRLLDFGIWRVALVQVLYSTGITYGPLMYYASARKQNAKIISPCLTLPLIDAFSSIFASLTMFCFLGHVADRFGIEVKEISSGGWDLAFTAYPGLMTTLAFPNLYSALFFGMLLLLGIDSIFGYYDYAITYLWDFFPRLRRRFKKKIVVLIFVLCMMAMGLQFVTTNGWWWFNLFNSYAAGDCIIFILVVEAYVLVVYFGLDNIGVMMKAKTREVFPRTVKFCLKYFSMPMMTVLFIYVMYKELKEVHLEPAWTQWFGRVLMSIPLLFILLGFLRPRRAPPVEKLIECQYGKTLEELHPQEGEQNKSENENSQAE